VNSETKNFRVIIVILLLAIVATVIYLVSLKLAYPLFQNTRLADPLAELHSLFPLYYVAIGIMALTGVACFIYRISDRGIHILLLLLLAIMLWYTPNYLAGYVHQPDGPRDLGVALQIPQVLQGNVFPSADYAVNYPTSYILDYTLKHVTGIEPWGYMHLFPLVSLCFFTLLGYAFASRLFGSRAAFITVLFAMVGLHYVFFHNGAHVVGMLLLMTALVLLWRRDTTSMALTFFVILAVIICHPISPTLLAIFLAAALIASFSRRLVKSQAIVLAMLVVCIGGWFIWPTLSLAPSNIGEPGVVEETSQWAKELQGSIFPSELKTTKLFLLGTPFIYKGIFNLNKGIYLLYALLAITMVGYTFYRSRSRLKSPRDFLAQLGGLSREEVFIIVSALILLILTILLGEETHDLIERGLTFAILAISGLLASITTRVYESATTLAKRFIRPAMIVLILFLTLSFPAVAYSIDAYTSFPISEEAGLKFLASYVPLDTKRLATNFQGQMTLYRPYIAAPVPLSSPSSLDSGDVFAFRRTDYYYAAMRFDLSFEDNRFTRYQSAVNTSSEFDKIYSSPTMAIFVRGSDG